MPKGRVKKNRSLNFQNKEAFLFLSPWLLGLLIFSIIPMVSSLYLSFTDYNMLTSPNFVGVKNYIDMFQRDKFFWPAMKATGIYVFLGVPLQLTAALLLALLLKGGVRGIGLFRSIFYVPSLIGGSVAIAVIWRQMFGMDGIINQFLSLFSPEKVNISWIAHPTYGIFTLVILLIWQFGSPMLIFLAAIKQIPPEFYESAQIDGANPFQNFFYITLPSISGVLLFNLIMQIISAFKAFTPAYVIGGVQGGTMNSMLFYTLHLYNQAFGDYQMGYASALAWVLFLIISIFTAIIFATSSKWVNYNE